MIKIGKTNTLKVLRSSELGSYLDAEHLDEVFLDDQVQRSPGDSVAVFLYKDGDAKIAATTNQAFVELDQCAYLEVVAHNTAGAFLNWGIPKDLFVPLNQQEVPMKVGKSYIVTVYLDEATQRLAASAKLGHYLYEFATEFEAGQPVDLLICGESDLGIKAVINHTHIGLIYHTDIFQPLKIGQQVQGYIKNLRPDHKIDLTLQRVSQQARKSLQDQIIDHLKDNDGQMNITDKSPPDEIYAIFSVSKSNFKKALGALYRLKKITIEKGSVSLNSNTTGR